MTELHTPEFFLLFFVPLLGLDLPEPPSKSFSIKKEERNAQIYNKIKFN